VDKKEQGGATAAFKMRYLHTWMTQHHTIPLEKAIDNFTRSVAGYCVATYVLGIGDRHNVCITTNSVSNQLQMTFFFVGGIWLRVFVCVMNNCFQISITEYNVNYGWKAVSH